LLRLRQLDDYRPRRRRLWGQSAVSGRDGSRRLLQHGAQRVPGTGPLRRRASRRLPGQRVFRRGQELRQGRRTAVLHRRPAQLRDTSYAAGRLVAEAARNAYVTSLAYTGTQLSTVTDPAGRALSFSYAGGRISSVTDPAGRTVSYGYDGAGNLTAATDATGKT